MDNKKVVRHLMPLPCCYRDGVKCCCPSGCVYQSNKRDCMPAVQAKKEDSHES